MRAFFEKHKHENDERMDGIGRWVRIGYMVKSNMRLNKGILPWSFQFDQKKKKPISRWRKKKEGHKNAERGRGRCSDHE